MKTITVVDLDIVKSVFQIHGIGAEGKVAKTLPVQEAQPTAVSIK